MAKKPAAHTRATDKRAPAAPRPSARKAPTKAGASTTPATGSARAAAKPRAQPSLDGSGAVPAPVLPPSAREAPTSGTTPSPPPSPATPPSPLTPPPVLDPQQLLELGPPRIRFSAQEIWHLTATVAVLSYSLSILLGPKEYPERFVPDGLTLVATTVSVATGFVLHELAHKFAAHRFGFWAEFRAAFLNLAVTLGLAIAPLGMTVAFPGAVNIFGRATRGEAGRIAVVGPLVNIVLAACALPFLTQAAIGSDLRVILETITLTNAVLAVFNLMPFGAFDGRKVLRWSLTLYLVALAAAVTLFGYTLVEVGAFEPPA